MKFFFLLALVSINAFSFDHDHKIFAEVLSEHVTRRGAQTLVDYKAIKHNSTRLDAYITTLGKVTKQEYSSWSEDEKLAALINGYNAWTIKHITNHYPVSSIRKIGGLFSSPWKMEFIDWLGDKVHLDHIEHDVIRKDFQEPRIHFALVCAAMGCPTLQEEPFTAAKLEEQLRKASKEFLNDPTENRSRVTGNTVKLSLSSILKWYGSDFGNEKDLKTYVLNEMGLAEVAKGKEVEIDYLDYDWSLNEAK